LRSLRTMRQHMRRGAAGAKCQINFNNNGKYEHRDGHCMKDKHDTSCSGWSQKAIDDDACPDGAYCCVNPQDQSCGPSNTGKCVRPSQEHDLCPSATKKILDDGSCPNPAACCVDNDADSHVDNDNSQSTDGSGGSSQTPTDAADAPTTADGDSSPPDTSDGDGGSSSSSSDSDSSSSSDSSSTDSS